MRNKTETPEAKAPYKYLYLSHDGTRITNTKKAKKGETLRHTFDSLEAYKKYIYGSK
jgi:hypothetical protein